VPDYYRHGLFYRQAGAATAGNAKWKMRNSLSIFHFVFNFCLSLVAAGYEIAGVGLCHR
jgi:hypothetical protein